MLLLLGDQPLVTAAHLANLIDCWSGSDNEIIATAYTDGKGPPVLFPGALLDDLAALNGDTGARQLISDPRFTTRFVDFAPAGSDIDCPADLERLQKY